MKTALSLVGLTILITVTYSNCAKFQAATGTSNSSSNAPVVLDPTFDNVSKSILNPGCVVCHGPTLAEAGVRFDTYTDTLITVNDNRLMEAVETGAMPIGSPELNAAETKLLSDWIADGAPNN